MLTKSLLSIRIFQLSKVGSLLSVRGFRSGILLDLDLEKVDNTRMSEQLIEQRIVLTNVVIVCSEGDRSRL